MVDGGGHSSDWGDQKVAAAIDVEDSALVMPILRGTPKQDVTTQWPGFQQPFVVHLILCLSTSDRSTSANQGIRQGPMLAVQPLALT